MRKKSAEKTIDRAERITRRFADLHGAARYIAAIAPGHANWDWATVRLARSAVEYAQAIQTPRKNK